jgi:trypsin
MQRNILLAVIVTELVVCDPSSKNNHSFFNGRYKSRHDDPVGTENERRIIGGYAAGTDDFPWAVLIKKIGGDSTICSGSVISKRWIVTAAHCILNAQNTGYKSPLPLGNTQVVIGCANLDSNKCVTYNVKLFRAHPCYTPSFDQDHDDIAMMELDRDVHLDPSQFALVDGVQGTAAFAEGSTVTIAGFGMTSTARQGSRTLMRAEINIATRSFCEQQNPYSRSNGYIDFANVICTGGPAGKDSCNGDSGGPIIFKNASGTPWLVGVLSKGSELPSEAAARQLRAIASYPPLPRTSSAARKSIVFPDETSLPIVHGPLR